MSEVGEKNQQVVGDGKKSETEGRKYIVMDIGFYAGSLNYDQGAGNYQALKKITKWDGKRYTLVSRYALRYSLLKTGEQLGLWTVASGNILARAGERDKTVIQPSIKILLSGEILNYPDYDFFGYLITGTTPQNSREAPVKISHAVSLTPYHYDSHFAGNLDMAKRMVEAGKAEKMDPNLFTVEEHQTYYIYTVVIDVDRIGKNDVYLAKDSKIEIGKDNKMKVSEIEVNANKLIVKEIDQKKKKEKKKEEIEIDNNKIKIEPKPIGEKILLLEQTTKDDKNNKIRNLIKAILNLNRDIKARKEFLHPKLLILGLYDGTYQTFKDRIRLSNAYEERYEEEIDKDGNNKVKVIKRVVKLQRPVFEISGKIEAKNRHGGGQPPVIDELKKLLEENKRDKTKSQQNEEDHEEDNNDKAQSLEKEIDIDGFLSGNNKTGVWIYRAPEIEVRNSDK